MKLIDELKDRYAHSFSQVGVELMAERAFEEAMSDMRRAAARGQPSLVIALGSSPSAALVHLFTKKLEEGGVEYFLLPGDNGLSIMMTGWAS